MTKIIGALNLRILPRDINSKNPRHLLNLIFSQWLPLANSTIQAVIDIVPPPTIAQQTRLPKIVYPDLSEETKEPKNKLERGLWACDSQEDSYVVAYVSKMFAVQKKDMPESKKASTVRKAAPEQEEDANTATEVVEDDEVLLGFSRLYSGRLRAGSTIAVILPKYDQSRGISSPRNRKFISFIKIKALYTMMGRDLVPISEVVAGNVFAISGFDGFVGRSATICSPSAVGFEENMSPEELDSKPEAECIINLGGLGLQVSYCINSSLIINGDRLLLLSEWR